MKISEIIKTVFFVILWIFMFLSVREEFDTITLSSNLAAGVVSLGLTYVIYFGLFEMDWSIRRK